MSGKYCVTFEGESMGSEDDREIEFVSNESNNSPPIPDDFMPRMVKYLESDQPYDILYQIKEIKDLQTQKDLDPKPFVAVIGKTLSGKKRGILLKEENGKLVFKASWLVDNLSEYISQLYEKPELFELVVVTTSEI